MEAGLNSDLMVNGKTYHVQTEDWGWENPFIVTKIFCEGAVLKSVKTPYQDILRSPLMGNRSISEAIQHQHKVTIDSLISGQF